MPADAPRGRPTRPSDVGRYTVARVLDPVNPASPWRPARGQDPVVVALGALQDAILRRVEERLSEQAAEFVTRDARRARIQGAVAEALSLPPRHVPVLLSGERAIQTEQLLALMLCFDITFEEVVAQPGGSGFERLIPVQYAGWIRRSGLHQMPTIEPPARDIDWVQVTPTLAELLQKMDRRGYARLMDSSSALMLVAEAIEASGGPTPALADRTADGRAALVFQVTNAATVEIAYYWRREPPDRAAIASLVRRATSDSAHPHDLVLVLTGTAHRRLIAALPATAGLRARGDAARVVSEELGSLGAWSEAGDLAEFSVLTLAFFEEPDDDLLVIVLRIDKEE